jgi:hypothetical protein
MSVDKYDEPDQRTDEENSSSVVQKGFADPSGTYPKRDYLFGPSTNQAARGVTKNTLDIGGEESVDLPAGQESQYPHNRVI